jgi:hypothetical protein
MFFSLMEGCGDACQRQPKKLEKKRRTPAPRSIKHAKHEKEKEKEKKKKKEAGKKRAHCTLHGDGWMHAWMLGMDLTSIASDGDIVRTFLASTPSLCWGMWQFQNVFRLSSTAPRQCW